MNHKTDDSELEAIRARKLQEMMQMNSTASATSPQEATASPVQITDANFAETVKDNSLVLVDFWAPWCGPCRMLGPVLEALASEYAGKVLFAKMNTDQNQATARRFGIMSIPTMMLFKDGQLVDQMVGAMPKQMLEARLAQHL